MIPSSDNINEQQASIAFSKQSVIFDAIYSGNTIVHYKRQRVRDHLSKYLTNNNFILELNSGTGEDAIWFAQQGHRLHATDISAGMQQILQEKVKAVFLDKKISTELCSFTKLEKLQQKGPYDMIFSNFAGLNCTNELDKVVSSFSVLLKPKGIVTLVILPKFCLWEFLLLFKGKFKTAFRRFSGKKGTKAQVEGTSFTCWYYNPSYLIQHLQKDFSLLSIEGLCSLVPPSYIEGFAEKYPKAYLSLQTKENKWKAKWPWRSIGDYYIISFQKKA
ncbi:MAG TPA: class I SAM-dependent methyltransferase [Ferruginibacter sp.]|nr:class I SAM-dependent methyltransferase [Ferruginibacter sp.]